VRYHYLDEGHGPVLLFVHGNPTWSFYWRKLILALRDRYRCVAVDHIGCGLSDKPEPYRYTLAQHVENLSRLVTELDLRDVTLLGHDWGGAIGLGAAVAAPERFGRFVLFNTAAFRDQHIPRRIALCRIPVLGKWAVRALNGFAVAAVRMAFAHPERVSPEVKAGYLAPYDSWAHRVATHEFVRDIPLEPNHPTFGKLAEIESQLSRFRDCPIQIQWGLRDWCFTTHFLDRWTKEFFPRAEVERWPDVGHYVVDEGHEQVLPRLQEFLSRTVPTLPGPVARVIAAPTEVPVAPARPEASSIVNVARRLIEQAAVRPAQEAVVMPRGRNSHGTRVYESWTFRELDQETDRLARGLRALGVRPGMRLALMVKPSFEFITLTFALFKVGAVAILIDPGMGASSLLKCLREAAPEGFLAIPLAHAILKLTSRTYAQAKIKITVGRRWFWGGSTYQDLRGGPWTGSELAPTQADDPAAIIFTSGSTGPPKGVLYRHGNFDAQVTQIQERFQIQPGEVNLPGFPLFALFDAAMGVTTIVPDMNPTRPARVDPSKIVEAIHDWQVTQAFGSPAMWNRVGSYCEKQGLKLPSVQRVLSAGAPVPPHVLLKMQDCIHADGNVFTPYGATEALPVASISAREVLQETIRQTRAGAGTCVGTKFPGITWKVIRIVDGPIQDESQIEELPCGEIGELIVRGPVVTTEYFERPEANALGKIRVAEGFWHRLGDVGSLDSSGRFWFCGRLAHRVLTADGPLYSVPCEEVFNAHPGIYRSALVGLGEPGRQVPCLILEPWPGKMPRDAAERNKLEQQLLELGAQVEVTRSIRKFLWHPSFPVDIRHNSKISREKLAVWAQNKTS